MSDVTLPTGDRLVAEIRRLRGLNRDPHVATLQLALGLGRTGVDYHGEKLERAGRLKFQHDSSGRRLWATVEVVEP